MGPIIKKVFIFSLAFLLFGGLLTGCKFSNNSSSSENINSNVSSNSNSELENELNEKQKEIYRLAKNSGYTGTYEEWLDSIKGDSVELKVIDGFLKWK